MGTGPAGELSARSHGWDQFPSILICYLSFSSNSQMIVCIVVSCLFSIYTDTDLDFAIVFINLKMVAFLRYGIFLPSVDILSV